MENDASKKLVTILTTKCVGQNDLLVKKINATTGAVLDAGGLIDELGDYLPYILYYAKLKNDPIVLEWCKAYLKQTARLGQSKNGLFMNVGTRVKKAVRFGWVKSIDNADTINGLVACMALDPSDETGRILDCFFSGVEKYYSPHGRVLYGVYEPFRFIKLPVANTLTTAYIAEEAVNYASQPGKSSWLELGCKLLSSYTQDPFFLQNGFFRIRDYHDRTSPIIMEKFFSLKKKPPSDSSVIVKDNCYVVFALLNIFRATGEQEYAVAARSWLEKFMSILTPEGDFQNLWRHGVGTGFARLQHAHSMIELLLDAAVTLGDEQYTKAAKKMTDLWLRRKSACGLVVESAETGYCLLDPNVDFMVELLRLSVICKDPIYREEAEALHDNIVKNFMNEHGMVWNVRGADGSILDPTIEVKFLGLALKGLLVMERVRQGADILRDPILMNVSRDR